MQTEPQTLDALPNPHDGRTHLQHVNSPEKLNSTAICVVASMQVRAEARFFSARAVNCLDWRAHFLVRAHRKKDTDGDVGTGLCAMFRKR